MANTEHEAQANYEYLEVVATIKNQTAYRMTLLDAQLAWGKFDAGKSPVDVLAHTEGGFTARGRDSSMSGTQGTVKWQLEGHQDNPTITATFENPVIGSSKASINCAPNVVSVSVSGEHGNSYKPVYTIG